MTDATSTADDVRISMDLYFVLSSFTARLISICYIQCAPNNKQDKELDALLSSDRYYDL